MSGYCFKVDGVPVALVVRDGTGSYTAAPYDGRMPDFGAAVNGTSRKDALARLGYVPERGTP